MMNTVRLLAFNTAGYLMARKTIYVLFFITLVVLFATGADLYSIFNSDPSTDPKALLSKQASILSRMFSSWSVLTTLASIIAAAGVVYADIKSKIVLGVLAKPVSRWQYLLGKWFGVLLFFYGFLAVGLAIVTVLMLFWDITFTSVFLTGAFHQVIKLTVYSAIAFTLSLFIAPILAGGISFIFFAFGSLFEQLMESDMWWASWLGSVLYYVQPAVMKENLLEKGVLNSLLDPNFSLYWSVIFENAVYASIIFF
ncbi:MAG: ABC transporter permease subunit, partial [Candidatus Halalkalibacterium sp. M3_1C_030]